MQPNDVSNVVRTIALSVQNQLILVDPNRHMYSLILAAVTAQSVKPAWEIYSAKHVTNRTAVTAVQKYMLREIGNFIYLLT